MKSSILRVLLPLLPLPLVTPACSDDEGGNVDAATGGQDAPTVDASLPDAPPGPPNSRVVGTWDLMSAGSTCGISFGAGFTAAAVSGSDYNFTLTLNDGSPQPPMITCAIRVNMPSLFTCSDFTQAGIIPPNCNVSLSLSNISGAIAGSAVEIQAAVIRTSPNCGAALNCGPQTHVSNGTIVP